MLVTEQKPVASRAAVLGRTEQELMLLAARTHIDSAKYDRVRSMLKGPVDWDSFIASANRNGVLALVGNTLFENFAADLSTAAQERLTEFRSTQLKRNIQLSAKLIDVVKMLNTEGISCMPFKGPLLAQRAYQSIALRQFVDLDILVKRDDLERSVDVLRSAGLYTGDQNADLGGFSINRRKDISLFSAGDDIRIEVHWKLSGSYFAMPVGMEGLWGRLEKMKLGGVEFFSLPFNDLFVYLCLHAARHGFERLEWLCDLNELVRSERDCDWDSVFAHARHVGCERAVVFALYLLREQLGTEIPRTNALTKIDPLMKLAAVRIREKWFTTTATPDALWDWYVYHLMLKEKRTDRLKLHLFYMLWYLKIIFRPNSADRSTFPLPAPLHSLYYILRPARLLLSLRRRHFR